MSELVEWLTKVLDEDERGFKFRIDQERNPQVEQLQMWGRPLAEMMLADVAAKRAIIGLHMGGVSYPEDCGLCNEGMPCGTVRHLASAYADRSGYNESWRP